jgi:hypothetical protein
MLQNPPLGRPHWGRCLNHDSRDLRIYMNVENNVEKSGKSFNQENRGSDKMFVA